jgi:predicted ABC-type ATPase
MPDILRKYEILHLRNIAANEKKIKDIFFQYTNQITLQASKIKFNGTVFNLSKYPALQKQINKTIEKMHTSILTTVVNGIDKSWALSNAKNDDLVKDRLGKKRPSTKAKQTLYDPHFSALKAFKDRTQKGMNLSRRVWNLLDPFKPMLEQALGLGVAEGTAAKKMATQVQQYLNEPDKLFRRVRDSEGKLQLSKAARDYHPGQGVYRSSYKNALRLTRTENNLAYRTADFERWQTIPFITGITVKLSNNHPRFDICDPLAGKYPKDFKFTGWHPQCMCYQVPEMMTDKEYNKLEDAILNGTPPDFRSAGAIVRTPPGFNQYTKDNFEKIVSYKNPPYWLKDNPKYLNKDWVRDKANKTAPTLAGSKADVTNVKEFKRASDLDHNISFMKNNDLITHDIYRDAKRNILPARKKLHNDIVDEFLAPGSSNTGYVYMTGGAPANGKSALIDSGKLTHPKGILNIDPDAIKKKLPEYNRMVKQGDSTAANAVHEESSYLSKRIVDGGLKKNYDLLIDGVGNGDYDDLIAKFTKYKTAGKKIRADYVTLDTDLSLELARKRAIKTGRKVPETYIRAMNKSVSQIVPRIIKDKVIDELYLWDTNINGKPRLILTMINGKLKMVNKKLYTAFLSKAK